MGMTKGDSNNAANLVEKVSLAEMRPGQTGTIVQIDGGHGLLRKLDALGIIVGQEITKVSGQWMRGPVVLRLNNTNAAMGFGMARSVLVQLPGKGRQK